MKTLSMMPRRIAWLFLFAASGVTPAEAAPQTSLRERIEAIQVPDVAWRRIPWKSCLLEGMEEARRENKPLMLWIFIDRPIDDTRC